MILLHVCNNQVVGTVDLGVDELTAVVQLQLIVLSAVVISAIEITTHCCTRLARHVSTWKIFFHYKHFSTAAGHSYHILYSAVRVRTLLVTRRPCTYIRGAQFFLFSPLRITKYLYHASTSRSVPNRYKYDTYDNQCPVYCCLLLFVQSTALVR